VTWRAFIALGLLLAPFSARATQISLSDFGPLAVTESFEGITDVDPNVGSTSFPTVLEPAIVSPYLFSSGATLFNAPNPGIFNDGPFIHDFSLGSGPSNDWGANGSVSSAADVPSGSAYLGVFDSPSPPTNDVSLDFRFSEDMVRVGAVATGAEARTVTLEVYDASDLLLESLTLNTVDVSQWDTNFLGIERSEGIRRAVFSGPDFGMDDLTFEVLAPEPSPLSLTALGLLGLALARRSCAGARRSAGAPAAPPGAAPRGR